MKLLPVACVLALMAAAQAFAPSSALTPRQAHARSSLRPALSMKAENSQIASFTKALATFTAAMAILAGSPHDAEAARSGGRVGGRSFSSPAPTRSYSAPSRSYSAPSYGGSYGGGATTIVPYRSSTTIIPMPMPMPMFSPFGYGGSVYYGGGYGGGGSLVNLLLVGGVVLTASQLLRTQVSSGGWSSVDVEGGSLGRGVGVVKLQVALNASDRSSRGILAQLKSIAERAETSSRGGLSTAVSEVCLALVRRQPDWIASASQYEYFAPRSAERAEAVFNTYAIAERTKVERETVSRFGGEDLSDSRRSDGVRPEDLGKPTQAVVTIVLALKGESLKRFQLERSINSASALRNVLTQVAGDATTDDGENVLGVELLWTPEEPWESLDRQAVLEDFPELMDL
ncbi:hypothetical protein JKP88DRAFT_230236 [Tribonema minus]|uniref:DUF1517 domain-containing protein n=1 Tax=Tribonema minus TaxID=303371 RepID=A0A835ZEJ7_9STRA|nr:hypothetical protein JKP88DRAFT_230236 [Tribonema minus]